VRTCEILRYFRRTAIGTYGAVVHTDMTTFASTETIEPAHLGARERAALARELYELNTRIFNGPDEATFTRWVLESNAGRTWLRIYRDRAGAVVGYFAVHDLRASFAREDERDLSRSGGTAARLPRRRQRGALRRRVRPLLTPSHPTTPRPSMHLQPTCHHGKARRWAAQTRRPSWDSSPGRCRSPAQPQTAPSRMPSSRLVSAPRSGSRNRARARLRARVRRAT